MKGEAVSIEGQNVACRSCGTGEGERDSDGSDRFRSKTSFATHFGCRGLFRRPLLGAASSADSSESIGGGGGASGSMPPDSGNGGCGSTMPGWTIMPPGGVGYAIGVPYGAEVMPGGKLPTGAPGGAGGGVIIIGTGANADDGDP